MNDNHNTFEGVATILSRYVPGVDYAKGMEFANLPVDAIVIRKAELKGAGKAAK